MRNFLTPILLIGAINIGASQGLITVNDHIGDYARLLEIQGKPINRSIVNTNNQFEIWTHEEVDADSLGVWSKQLRFYQDRNDKGSNLYLISPRVDYVYSSKYSRSYNDGPLWSGKGSTIGLNVGIKGKWGPLTGVFYPNFYHAQNNFFQLRGGLTRIKDPFNYQLARNIDYVQIFGLDPVNEFDLGQSYVSLELGNAIIKFGTENFWWGPSVLNPIMMSNTGPGFPHLNIGTKKPARTKYGDFEVTSIWGQLKESDFFRFDANTVSRRFIAGLSLGYRPSFSEFMKGFSIGIGRILQKNWPDSGLSFSDIFLSLKNTDANATVAPNGDFVNDDTDQYISLDARWFFEKSGAEIYLEWVRNDFWLDFKDLVSEPEHGSVFTVGMQKAFKTNKATWRIGFENTSLATTRTREVRNSGDIYTHTVAIQGYTHRGFLLGAPIGPGSKSQLIRLDRFDENGKYGFSINRIRFNDNFFFRTFDDFTRHDVEWTFGFEAIRFINNFEVTGRFNYSRRMNWNYYHNSDVNNFQLITSIKYHLDGKPLLTLFDK